MHISDGSFQADAEAILSNAIHIMLADGQIDEREIDLINSMAKRLGLMKVQDVNMLLQRGGRASSTELSPESQTLCLAECMQVMVADGETHPAEARAWRHLAISMGIEAGVAMLAFDTGLTEVEQGRDPLSAMQAILNSKMNEG